MKFDFTGSRWFLLMIAIVLPLLLLAVAAVLNAGICYIMVILVWIGFALMFFYLPTVKD
jgi:hypothetical protein